MENEKQAATENTANYDKPSETIGYMVHVMQHLDILLKEKYGMRLYAGGDDFLRFSDGKDGKIKATVILTMA